MNIGLIELWSICTQIQFFCLNEFCRKQMVEIEAIEENLMVGKIAEKCLRAENCGEVTLGKSESRIPHPATQFREGCWRTKVVGEQLWEVGISHPATQLREGHCGKKVADHKFGCFEILHPATQQQKLCCENRVAERHLRGGNFRAEFGHSAKLGSPAKCRSH